MRSKLLLIALSTALAGCTAGVGPDTPSRGLVSTNVPVVTTANYVFDVAAPRGVLAPGEAGRLNAWFQTLGLGYGDSVYVEGPDSEMAKGQVARVAGDYGMLVEPGVPATAGGVPPGSVRVIVARRSASVPGCPTWSTPSSPNYSNKSMSNFGCGVNTNLAMQVANPEDLLHGREGASAVDAVTGAKAIQMYRDWPLTGVFEGQTKRPFKPIEDVTQQTGGK
jgi:pilus assembly protein CpaD